VTPERTSPRRRPLVVDTAALIAAPRGSCAQAGVNSEPDTMPAAAAVLQPRKDRRSI
jgi:hypothetical protein